MTQPNEHSGRLELTWANKHKALWMPDPADLEDKKFPYQWVERDDPRVLEIRPLQHIETVGEESDNLLIQGDSLEALKALSNDPQWAKTFVGKVKLIYIDPPFNTGGAFENYDDALEHSVWLAMMRERLSAAKSLLAEDGFLCCHIDDSEGHHLKVMLDDLFGRSNYLATLQLRVRYASKTLKQGMAFHREVEYVHVYRNSPSARPVLVESEADFSKFRYSIEVLGEPVRTVEMGGRMVEVYEKGTYRISEGPGHVDGLKEIWASGTILDGNSSGRFFRDHLTGRAEEDGLGVLYRVSGIGDDHLPYRYFTGPNKKSATKGKYFQGVPLSKREGSTSTSPILGLHDFAAEFGNCRHEGGVDFRGGKKPEALLKFLLSSFSRPGDIVLDYFAGSGTTASVAHKMGRRWITVEHSASTFETLLQPRLKRVIEGDDLSGVSTSEISDLPSGIEAGQANLAATVVEAMFREGKLDKQFKKALRDLDPESLEEHSAKLVKSIAAAIRKTERTGKVETLWEAGGGYKVLKTAAPIWELDEDGDPILRDGVTSGAFAESMRSQLGFSVVEARDGFIGRRGRQLLAVVMGLVDEREVRQFASRLREGERALIVGTAVTPEAQLLLKELSKGSKLIKAPDGLFGKLGRVIR